MTYQVWVPPFNEWPRRGLPVSAQPVTVSLAYVALNDSSLVGYETTWNNGFHLIWVHNYPYSGFAGPCVPYSLFIDAQFGTWSYDHLTGNWTYSGGTSTTPPPWLFLVGTKYTRVTPPPDGPCPPDSGTANAYANITLLTRAHKIVETKEFAFGPETRFIPDDLPYPTVETRRWVRKGVPTGPSMMAGLFKRVTSSFGSHEGEIPTAGPGNNWGNTSYPDIGQRGLHGSSYNASSSQTRIVKDGINWAMLLSAQPSNWNSGKTGFWYSGQKGVQLNNDTVSIFVMEGATGGTDLGVNFNFTPRLRFDFDLKGVGRDVPALTDVEMNKRGGVFPADAAQYFSDGEQLGVDNGGYVPTSGTIVEDPGYGPTGTDAEFSLTTDWLINNGEDENDNVMFIEDIEDEWENGLVLNHITDVEIDGVTNPSNWSVASDSARITAGTNEVVVQVPAPPPTTAPLAAVGDSGVLNGEYTYRVTFVIDGIETEGSPESSSVLPSNQSVVLTGIPLGPAGTSARKVYRSLYDPTDESWSAYLLVTTINDNTTDSYTDNVADADLGDPIPQVPDSATIEFRIANVYTSGKMHFEHHRYLHILGSKDNGDIRSLIMELVAQPDAASPADTFRFEGADQVSATDAEFDLCLPLADTTWDVRIISAMRLILNAGTWHIINIKLTTKTDPLRAAVLVPYAQKGLLETLINGKISIRQEETDDALANVDAFRDSVRALAVFDDKNWGYEPSTNNPSPQLPTDVDGYPGAGTYYLTNNVTPRWLKPQVDNTDGRFKITPRVHRVNLISAFRPDGNPHIFKVRKHFFGCIHGLGDMVQIMDADQPTIPIDPGPPMGNVENYWRSVWFPPKRPGVSPQQNRIYLVARDDLKTTNQIVSRQSARNLVGVTEVGFYLPGDYTKKLNYKGANAASPQDHEFAILRQEPGGNQLYILAKVRASQLPTTDSRVQVRVKTSVTDTTGILVNLSYSGADPQPNIYHFRKPNGQEIVMVDPTPPGQPPQPSIDDVQIQVHMSGDNTTEYTTYDHAHTKTGNYKDSEAVKYGQLRGRARYHSNTWGMGVPTLATLLRFIKAAGVEKMEVFAVAKPKMRHELPVKNQADLLYYSGHGHLANPQLRGKIDCWDIDYDPKEKTGYFGVDDIWPNVNWTEDLQYFVIAGCSVLAPGIYTSPKDGKVKGVYRQGTFYYEDEGQEITASEGPGIHWATLTLRNPNLNNVGPLKGLCGYWFDAPADREIDKQTGRIISEEGKAVKIAQAFTRYLTSQVPPTETGDRVLDAWLEANRSNSARAIVYTQTSYWYVWTGLFDRVYKAESGWGW